MEALVLPMPQLEILPGHWHRAANLRANLLAKKLKANLADTLIAQCCIDHGVALITRDTDFRHFAKHGGLKLAV
jgi:predicted nucleic acid-binding protein